MSTVQAYLDKLPDSQRLQLERVRRISLEHCPEAKEAISYGMPALKYQGYGIIWYAAFKNHMSVFPGTIHFTEEEPISESAIHQVIDTQLQKMKEKPLKSTKSKS